MISNLSGFFLSTIIPQMIDEIIKIPPLITIYDLPKNRFIRLVTSGIDIGFDIRRNLSGEFWNLSLKLEVRYSAAEKKQTFTLSSSFSILLKSSIPSISGILISKNNKW